MILTCTMCGHEIADISEDTRLPIQGSMFPSKDPKHGFPPPWSPVVGWEYMYCPLCSKRPFLDPADDGNISITTNEGPRVITAKGVIDVTPEVVDIPKREVVDVTPEMIDKSELLEEHIYEEEPTSTFEYLLESGEITQKGSWFAFEGKNYRRADLEEIING